MTSRLPLLLLILPLAAALLALALGRRRRAAAVVALVAIAALLAVAALAAVLGGEPAAELYGRALTLTAAVRRLLLLVYALVGGLLVLDWFRPLARPVVAVALAALSPLAAALLIAPVGAGLVLWALAWGLLAAALYGGRYEAAGAAWRSFLMGALGLSPLIWAAWTQTAGQGGEALPLALLLATLLLLAGFPFHIWLTGLARWSSPGALALALGPAHIVIVALLFGVLDLTPAIRASAAFQTALRGSAVLAALLAAFLMNHERTGRGLLAGALLLDAGLLPVAALAPGGAGLAVALAALIGRTLALLLIALATSWPAGGGARAEWLRRALWFYGCLSLVGLPLTPGLAGRWGQLSLLGGWPALAVLLALAVAAWATYHVATTKPSAPEATEGATAAGRGEQVAAAVLLGVAALLGVWPGWLLALATRLAG